MHGLSNYISDEIRLYREIYDLQEYQCVIPCTPKDYFEYCKLRSYFVILCLTTIDGKIFVSPYLNAKRVSGVNENIQAGDLTRADESLMLSDGYLKMPAGSQSKTIISRELHSRYLTEGEVSNSDLSDMQCRYTLPSGTFKPDSHDNLVDTARAVATRYLLSEMVGEIYPLTYFKNTFHCGDDEHEHHGVGMLCRLSITGHEYQSLYSSKGGKLPGLLLNAETLEKKHFSHYWNLELFNQALEFLKSGFHENEEEIMSSSSLKARNLIHKFIFKPAFKLVKTVPTKEFTEKLIDLVNESNEAGEKIKYLDIACGNDYHGISLAQGCLESGDVIVNDLAWLSVSQIKSSNHLKLDNLFFTNHSAAIANYRDNAFNICVCKNVLHHIRDGNELEKVLSNLLRVTSDVIIVQDYENPIKEKGLPYYINLYYQKFLYDQGNNFLTFNQFLSVINSTTLGKWLDKKNLKKIALYQRSSFGSVMTAVFFRQKISRNQIISILESLCLDYEIE